MRRKITLEPTLPSGMTARSVGSGWSLVLLALIGGMTQLEAQPAYRVKDINTESSSASSSPRDLVDAGGLLFFTARSKSTFGPQLWRSDGTENGTILLWENPFETSPNLQGLEAVGSTLFFFVGTRGDLWKSDGTPAGTVLVKSDVSDSGETPIAVDGTLFFVDADRLFLWVSDGTEAGTEPIFGEAGCFIDKNSLANVVEPCSLLLPAGGAMVCGKATGRRSAQSSSQTMIRLESL